MHRHYPAKEKVLTYYPVSSKYGYSRNWAPWVPKWVWGAYKYGYWGVYIYDKNGYPAAEIGITYYPSGVGPKKVSSFLSCKYGYPSAEIGIPFGVGWGRARARARASGTKWRQCFHYWME